MQPRETVTFTASNNDVLVLNTYVTAREGRLIDASMFSSTPAENISALDRYNAMTNSQDKTLEVVIVSVNGKKNGVDGFVLKDYLLDLPKPIFKTIIAKIDELLVEKKTT
jgi:hypothetical protein